MMWKKGSQGPIAPIVGNSYKKPPKKINIYVEVVEQALRLLNAFMGEAARLEHEKNQTRADSQNGNV